MPTPRTCYLPNTSPQDKNLSAAHPPRIISGTALSSNVPLPWVFESPKFKRSSNSVLKLPAWCSDKQVQFVSSSHRAWNLKLSQTNVSQERTSWHQSKDPIPWCWVLGLSNEHGHLHKFSGRPRRLKRASLGRLNTLQPSYKDSPE